ncbi:MAG TPA: TetR family transcriptional regulator [Herpetosiphonaceae bacterium]
MGEPEPEAGDPRQAQRANILAGARLAFARKGAAATMADVAAAAGVSQGLAYRYFDGKEAIYRELVEQALAEAGNAAAAPPEAATPGQRLALLVAGLLEYRRDHPETFQLLDQALGADGAPAGLIESIRARRAAFASDFRALIVAGQASGEVAPGDPDQLALAVTAALDGLARVALRDPARFKLICPDPAILLRMLLPER